MPQLGIGAAQRVDQVGGQCVRLKRGTNRVRCGPEDAGIIYGGALNLGQGPGTQAGGLHKGVVGMGGHDESRGHWETGATEMGQVQCLAAHGVQRCRGVD